MHSHFSQLSFESYQWPLGNPHDQLTEKEENPSLVLAGSNIVYNISAKG